MAITEGRGGLIIGTRGEARVNGRGKQGAAIKLRNVTVFTR
jgi:hypothetical protein